MTTTITQYKVSTPDATTPIGVAAIGFYVTPTGAIVLTSEAGQTVAAFAEGAWTSVTPVVTP